jgi:response regulator RpfG family c-di-GMP phosphodiesterase
VFEYFSIRNDLTEIFQLQHELVDTQKEIIYKVGDIAETRSQETGSHVKRVSEYAKFLGELAGLDDEQTEWLYFAAPMHDIGKIGIPDNILTKPGPLNADEWIIMKSHSQIGYNIFKNSKRPILQAAAIISKEHHEKYDGSGYPNGISGESINMFARIIAIADVFDALEGDRVYKKAWPLDDISNYFKEQRGKHFDPYLVDLFLDNFDSFLKIRDQYNGI